MTRRNFRQLGFGAVVLLVASCSMPTEGCGCSPATYSLNVSGSVLATDGAPVANAIIRATVFANSCTDNVVRSSRTAAGAEGRFQLHVISPLGFQFTCVRVGVYPDTVSTSAPLAAVDRVLSQNWNGDSLLVTLVVP